MFGSCYIELIIIILGFRPIDILSFSLLWLADIFVEHNFKMDS